MNRIEKPKTFDLKKTEFFSILALNVKRALELHRSPGDLLKKNAGGKRDWGNVSEHCLVEVARVEVLADLLGVSEETKRKLMIAAALHDYNKKSEIQTIERTRKTDESVFSALKDVEERSNKMIIGSGFDRSILRITKSSGGYPETLIEIKKILDTDNQELSDEDIACIVMNYVDGYTQGSDWVEPAATDESGNTLNDVDRRTAKISANTKYDQTEAEAKKFFENNPFFQGKKSAVALRDVSHIAEKKMGEIIGQRAGLTVCPEKLPEMIDQEIIKKINER